MAQYEVTSRIAELAEYGVTSAEVEARLGRTVEFNGDRVWVFGRQGEQAVARLLDEAKARAAQQRREAALQAGRLVEWRKVAGTWLLAGRGLTEGQIVTVTRKDGRTSEEVVGQIIAERDGLTLARPGRI